MKCHHCEKEIASPKTAFVLYKEDYTLIFCKESCSVTHNILETKYCAGCELTKTANQFHKNPTTSTGLATYCKECCKIKRKKRIYDLTPEREAEILESQGGVCALCRRDRKLVVDHDHKTGVVRGLLCIACNTILGKSGDDIAGLEAVIAYLRVADDTPTLEN